MGANHELLQRFVTTADAAKIANVTIVTIYKWAAAGRIEAYRIGANCTLYLRDEIESVAAERASNQHGVRK